MYRYENVPYQYHFSANEVLGREPKLLLTITTELARSIQKHVKLFSCLDQVLERHGLQKFTCNFFDDDAVGFDNAIKVRTRNPKHITLEIPYPEVTKDRGKCKKCKGKGRNKYGRCPECFETGREWEYYHRDVQGVVCSLEMLTWGSEFKMLEQKETEREPFQLIDLRITAQVGAYFLGGWYSAKFMDVIRGWQGYQMPKVNEDMACAYYSMYTKYEDKRSDKHYLRHSVGEKGWLTLSCPGDACDLHPAFPDIPETGGYQFSCHNVDTGVQLLTLLTGLAAITDVVRWEP